MKSSFFYIYNFISNQKKEIIEDPVLKNFGFFLILIHLLTGLYFYNSDLVQIISNPTQGYCWPFFSNCREIRSVLSPYFSSIFFVYFCLSAFMVVYSFFHKENVWIFLFILQIFKTLIISLDYQMMGNYHFMPQIVSFYFLFFPQKRAWIFHWILAFYLAAASLKLNNEWLSGASLSINIFKKEKAILPYLSYVGLLIEVIGPQLFYFKNRSLQWLGLASLISFHLVSFFWVGFFYPTVMMSLLMFYFLHFQNDISRAALDLTKKNILIPFGVFLFFIYSQVQSFSASDKSALFGDQRLFALNMFDANAICKGSFFVYDKSTRIQTEVPFRNENYAVRIVCDTIMFLNQGESLCRSKKPDEVISGFLSGKRRSDPHDIELIKEDDLCQRWL